MKRRAFLTCSLAGGLFLPRIIRAQAAPFTFFDPQIYAKAPTAVSYHPTVVNWAARVVTNGGAAPSAATKACLSTFCYALDAASLTSLMVSVCCLVPDNLIAAITPLLVGGGRDPWLNQNFLAGDLTVNGLLGNGSTKFLETGISPTWIPGMPDSGGCTIYYYTNPNDNGVEIAWNDVVDSHQFALQFYAGTIYFDCYVYSTGRISYAASGFTGYVSGNRIASNSEDIYTANSGTTHGSVVHGAGAPGTIGIGEVYCFAANNFGGAAYYSAKRLSFAAIHQGLTSAQSLAFYNSIQAMRVAFGGGYV
jgi:hypothetical protein